MDTENWRKEIKAEKFLKSLKFADDDFVCILSLDMLTQPESLTSFRNLGKGSAKKFKNLLMILLLLFL